MGADSKIAWTDHTFNPWWGCEKVSAGCTHCYADAFAHRLGHGTTRPKLWGHGSERKIASEAMWGEPLRWNRAAEKAGRRARVFCASMADVFEDRPELLVPRARLAMLIALTPHLDWLLLTKRPENTERLWVQACGDRRDKLACVCGDHGRSELCGEIRTNTGAWATNIWLGTTCEDQASADFRIPRLLATTARVRFLSCEPLLGPVDLTRIAISDGVTEDVLGDGEWRGEPEAPPGVDWVIVGGESGGKARPFLLEWARALRDQCRYAGAPIFVKQLGTDPVQSQRESDAHGSLVALRHRKGGDPAEWPEDLRVREWPEPRA